MKVWFLSKPTITQDTINVLSLMIVTIVVVRLTHILWVDISNGQHILLGNQIQIQLYFWTTQQLKFPNPQPLPVDTSRQISAHVQLHSFVHKLSVWDDFLNLSKCWPFPIFSYMYRSLNIHLNNLSHFRECIRLIPTFERQNSNLKLSWLNFYRSCSTFYSQSNLLYSLLAI